MGRIRDAYAALRGSKAAQEFPATDGAQFLVPLGMSGRPVVYQQAFDLADHADELVAASRDVWRTNLAEPPLVVFRDGQPDYTHPLSQRFAHPNAHFTQTMMWRFVSDHLTGPGKGGAYLLAVKSNGGEVAELWMKSGDEVRPIRSREKFISGYEWKDGNRWVPVPEWALVIHLYFPDSDDLWAHRSPLHDVVKSLRTNDNASQWLDYMLQNGGAPSQVLVVEAAAETARQMQDKINDEYMGAENVGKVGVIGGSKATTLDLGSRIGDIDLGPLKDRIELAVARSYGIPAELLQLFITAGKGEGLQGNSYREKRKILYANKLTPTHHMIEERVALTLAPLYGLAIEDIRFDYSGMDVFDDTPLEKAQRVTAMASYTSTDERRGMMGLEPSKQPGADDIPELVLRNRLSALTSYGSDDKAHGRRETKAIVTREEKLLAFDTKARSLEASFARRAERVFAAERKAAKEALAKLDLEKASDREKVTRAALKGLSEKEWREAFADVIRDVLFDAGKDAADRFDVTFDITHPDALSAVLDRVDKLAGSVTDTTRQAVQGAVRRGIDDGLTLREVANSITADVGPLGTMTAETRAATIARTETIGALNEGDNLGAAQANAETPLTKEWLSAGDGSVRDSHMIDGEVIPFDGTFSNGLAYPGDPSGGPDEVINCFPGETLVQSPGTELAFRRQYDGTIIRIHTADGHTLAGTPNHPVLTDAGWKALGSLEEGDTLVCAGAGQEVGSVDPDVQNVPSSIKQVFDAAAVLRVTQRVHGSDMDFHGDGADGEVEIVATDGLLDAALVAALEQHGGKGELTTADLREAQLLRYRLLVKFGLARRSTTSGDVRGPSESSALIGASAAHADVHGIASVPGSDTESDKPSADGPTINAKSLGKSLLGGSCEVFTSDVVKIEAVSFSGHVYNLQTVTGAYIANGIVAHNCRCVCLYDTAPEG